MNWEWIVPAVVLVVWILTHVIRPEEQPAKEAPLQPLDDGEPAAPRPVSEVDRFLEEINRMRQRAAQEQGRPLPPRESPRPVTVSQDIPSVTPAEVIPVVEPVRSVTRPKQKRPAKAAPAAVAKPAPVPPVAIVPTIKMPAPAAVTTNLRALLRNNPSAVRNAILLQEILSAPRSRRPIR